MSTWDGGFRDRWATICSCPPREKLEHRAGVEPANAWVAIRPLLLFAFRCMWHPGTDSNREQRFWRPSASPSATGAQLGRPGGSRTHSVRRRRFLRALRKPFRHWPETWWPARDSNPEQLVSETSASAKIAPAGHGARGEIRTRKIAALDRTRLPFASPEHVGGQGWIRTTV